MIAAWMIYSLLVSGLLYAAARAAEVVCRGLGAPTRFVWALALGVTIGLSGNALRVANARATTAAPARAVALGTAGNTTAGHEVVATPAARPSRWRSAIQSLRAASDFTAGVLDPNALAGSTRFDRPIAIAASLSAVAAIVYLVVVLIRLRRIALECALGDVDGHRVLVSEDVGPALIGTLRPRIVVPRWVLSLSVAERRDILAHEREHASAGDPALAIGAALLVALLPWNVGVWGMFGRLRLAIEADCDARVLRSRSDVGRYGALLLTVYERTVGNRTPRLAFVERRSHLEERIRRLARRTPRLYSASGAFAIAASVVLAIAACETTPPSKAARDSAVQRMSARSRPSVSVVGVEPPCLMSPGNFITPRNPDGTSRRPSMTELMARVRSHRPHVFGPRESKPLVLGLLLDENCTIRRDTVIEHAPAGMSDALVAATFGDTTGFAPYRGMAGFPSPKNGGPLIVIFAVKPSQPWRERVDHNDCGFGLRSDEFCSMQGPLEFRMLDSVRALIAVRRFRAPNQPVDHLFLVTLARPTPALTSLSMPHAVVSFQGGAVYVEDFNATRPLWLFVPSTTNGLTDLKHKRDVQVFSDLVGVAHYTGLRLTLEQILQLVPARRCDGPKGACYEVNGQKIEFPA